MEESGPSIDDYIGILRRRKLLFIFTTPILLLLSVIVVTSLPALFESTAIILIQGQDIPEEMVKSTVVNQAEQQIETTRQKILTSAKIIEIIDKTGLYADIRKSRTIKQLSDSFEKSMSLRMIEADVPGANGRISTANVAFIVSFLDHSPQVAQRVANELATLFLEENVKSRTTKANETAQFLHDEVARMQKRVQSIENKIADFKVQYGDSLPELLSFNLGAVERLDQQIINTQDESVRVKSNIHELSIELSNLSPYVQYSSSQGSAVITPRQRLMELKEQYAKLIIVYADSHPDIIRLEKEIKVAEETISETGDDVSEEDALNPLYRQTKSRITSMENELVRLRDRRKHFESDLATYKERIIRTHQVQRQYDEMTRDYQGKIDKYQELHIKLLDSNVAQNMEAENKAGSFKMIEPPSVPEKPVKPSRKKLLLMAFILSFGAGGGLMLAAEFLAPGVRGVANISRIIEQAPLAVIQHIDTERDQLERRHNRFKLMWVTIGFLILGIVVFHFFVMALDELWLKISTMLNLV
ncbi:MAG: hypothetical protein COA42_04490 [Alteromonadaceae bacterium]|nr:MAG: hypothetical protein COA42_04490 [Alteromonadaceae bacterium]